MSSSWFRPHRELAAAVTDRGHDPRFELLITPADAGWGYSSLRILALTVGDQLTVHTGDQEMILLPLAGSAWAEIDGEKFEITGRDSVFAAVTDFAYLPVDSSVTIGSVGGGRFALPGARAEQRLPFRYAPAEGVPVELRGAGSCSRQVNNFATPAEFATDKLIACEVITPAANFSSYPPHKHDETGEDESNLEEIYYYQFQTVAGAGDLEPAGVGYQRVYGTAERPIEVLEQVTDGDVVLIPHGWHGPAMASPSHHMYYLNVMAGPEPTRAWKIRDDPAHGWVRGGWVDTPVDPRLPFYSTPSAPSTPSADPSTPA